LVRERSTVVTGVPGGPLHLRRIVRQDSLSLLIERRLSCGRHDKAVVAR